MIHTHCCTLCHTRYDCDGDLEHNYDGFPEVVCTAYHYAAETECIECQSLRSFCDNEGVGCIMVRGRCPICHERRPRSLVAPPSMSIWLM